MNRRPHMSGVLAALPAGVLAGLMAGLLLAFSATLAEASDTADVVTPDTTPAAESESTRPPFELASLDWVIDSALSQPHLKGARVGLLVESLSTGRVLYERDAGTPMTPASNMKIVTGAAALSLLGPGYRFETTVLTDAPVVGTTVDGNLYVKGTGDPSMVSEQLWKLAESVRVLGIERIGGDLVLDAGYFDDVSTTSETVAEGDRAYHARTGALSLNFNSIAVHTTAGGSTGAPAVVSLAPATSFVELLNEVTTGRSGSSSTLNVRRSFDGGRNTITVSGRVPAGSGSRVHYRSLDDGTTYFGTVLREFLEAAGVTIDGATVEGRVPEDAEPLVTHDSKPMALIVRDLNKFSNNFVAEQLVKALSASSDGPPGTTEGGVRVLEGHLAAADSGSCVIRDGSGFSAGNRLTPRGIVSVLRSAMSDFGTSYEFAASLSVSGEDGTLANRMRYAELRRAVRAKTGLLDGVTAISGIMETASGEEVLFSIIVNGFDCEAWRVHDFEHSILSVIGRG